MQKEIVDALKEQYTRDLRKQIVKAILRDEKSSDKQDLQSTYNVINQIFSYILNQLNWNMAEDTSSWDNTPLTIIKEVFPNIETTKWFKDMQLQTTKSIKVEDDFT